jgi:predicted MFS family arabinose efflux permease
MEAPATKKWIAPFVATLVGMMALQISSLGFAPLLPHIQQAFGMSYSQIGLFTGIYGLLAIILSVPAGLAAKYFGEKRVLIAGLVVVALGLVALSAAGSFTEAFLGRDSGSRDIALRSSAY